VHSADHSHTMLAAEHYPDLFVYGALPKRELLKVHHSKISLHRAKANYSYPTIRLPHTFSTLAGLPARIYQTVHEGALAFLVVVSKGVAAENSSKQSKNAKINAKMPALTWRRSPVRIRPSPSFFCELATPESPVEAYSDTRIVGTSQLRRFSNLFLDSYSKPRCVLDTMITGATPIAVHPSVNVKAI
jgi:hypothetical protein